MVTLETWLISLSRSFLCTGCSGPAHCIPSSEGAVGHGTVVRELSCVCLCVDMCFLSGVKWLPGKCAIHLLRNFQTSVQSGCTTLHSRRQWRVQMWPLPERRLPSQTSDWTWCGGACEPTLCVPPSPAGAGCEGSGTEAQEACSIESVLSTHQGWGRHCYSHGSFPLVFLSALVT